MPVVAVVVENCIGLFDWMTGMELGQALELHFASQPHEPYILRTIPGLRLMLLWRPVELRRPPDYCITSCSAMPCPVIYDVD